VDEHEPGVGAAGDKSVSRTSVISGLGAILRADRSAVKGGRRIRPSKAPGAIFRRDDLFSTAYGRIVRRFARAARFPLRDRRLPKLIT